MLKNGKCISSLYVLHSSFDQNAKPDGLPKRAFSRTGGRAKSDSSVSLSLSLADWGVDTAENEAPKVPKSRKKNPIMQISICIENTAGLYFIAAPKEENVCRN